MWHWQHGRCGTSKCHIRHIHTRTFFVVTELVSTQMLHLLVTLWFQKQLKLFEDALPNKCELFTVSFCDISVFRSFRVDKEWLKTLVCVFKYFNANVALACTAVKKHLDSCGLTQCTLSRKCAKGVCATSRRFTQLHIPLWYPTPAAAYKESGQCWLHAALWF